MGEEDSGVERRIQEWGGGFRREEGAAVQAGQQGAESAPPPGAGSQVMPGQGHCRKGSHAVAHRE